MGDGKAGELERAKAADAVARLRRAIAEMPSPSSEQKKTTEQRKK